MTEEEWLKCEDPRRMLEFLRDKVDERKLRLFSVACCRRVLFLSPTKKRSQESLEVAERFADCLATRDDLTATFNASLVRGLPVSTLWALVQGTFEAAVGAADHISLAVSMQKTPKHRPAARFEESSVQSHITRDVFGNPFRPTSINPNWLTPTVTNLATAAYEERALPSGELDTPRLAILADAIEDAGCDNQDILTHLRSPGPHVRGCHVLDLLLGKS